MAKSSVMKTPHDTNCVPAPFVEKTVLSLLNSLLVEDHLTTYMRVYFWALYSGLWIHVSVFMSEPHCFDYCSFVVSSDIVSIREASSFLLFQDCFSYAWSLAIPYEFGSGFFCFHKAHHWDFSRDWIVSVDHFG